MMNLSEASAVMYKGKRLHDYSTEETQVILARLKSVRQPRDNQRLVMRAIKVMLSNRMYPGRLIDN
jgi:hypothetical protein